MNQPVGSRNGNRSSDIAAVALSATVMLLGFPLWYFALLIITMGSAGCTDSSDAPSCNHDLMNALSYTALAGISVGLLLTLTLGVWQIAKGREATRTLLAAWAVSAVPMLIFIVAGFL